MYVQVHVHVTAVIIYFLFALEAYDMSEELTITQQKVGNFPRSITQRSSNVISLHFPLSLAPKMKNCLGRSDVGKLGKYFTSLSDLDKIIQCMSSRS